MAVNFFRFITPQSNGPLYMDDSKNRASTHEAIEEIVRSIPRGEHLTAPEVFEKAQERGLKVSLSTVYRTLGKLKADGNVFTVSGDRGVRYEAAEEGPAHDHLICLGCGLTIEFYDELIRGFGKTVAQRKGFEHSNSRFDILGYCENCKSSNELNKANQAQDALSQALEKTEDAVTLMRHTIEQLRNRKGNKALAPLKSAMAQLSSVIEDLDFAESQIRPSNKEEV